MVKKIIVLLLFIGWALTVVSQTVDVNVNKSKKDRQRITDSLEQKLAITPDTSQWEILYELSQNFREYSRRDSVAMQKGMMYSQQ
ncbi:MAG: hypothetical protein KDD63_20935, partial [Bacteroidetes bacterium]|nr:hypothetical protein [Bacteroidota bacterium]